METTNIEKETCVFCGKEREYKYVTDDGYDYYGHQRGQYSCKKYDKGCDCPLGKIEHERQKIKKMCMNCKSYDGFNCTNKKMISKLSNTFDMPSKLKVKCNTRCCEEWEVDVNIFKCLVE